MIEVGSKAPDFNLESQFKTEFSLREFCEKKNVILIFYPKDWTYTWSKEIPGIELMINQFLAEDTQVLGISVDSKESHENWAKSLGGVSFPLLQDYHPKGAMSKSYGVYLEDKGYAARSTVIVDKKGIVRYSFVSASERDIQELLAECKKINS